MNNNIDSTNQQSDKPGSVEVTPMQDTSPFTGPIISSRPKKRKGLVIGLIVLVFIVVVFVLFIVFRKLI